MKFQMEQEVKRRGGNNTEQWLTEELSSELMLFSHRQLIAARGGKSFLESVLVTFLILK